MEKISINIITEQGNEIIVDNVKNGSKVVVVSLINIKSGTKVTPVEFYEKLISHFIKYPIYSNDYINNCFSGDNKFIFTSRSFFPELSPNKIYINVSYPGAYLKKLNRELQLELKSR